MQIWLDTADLEVIETAKQMGLLYGVTTNPSIIAESKRGLEDLLETILAAQSGPVTVQLTAQEATHMIQQGEALFQFSNRIIMKIPVTAEGLKAIYALSNKGIATMATAIFNLQQVLLSASSKATYLAPYFSRICDEEIHGINAFKSMLKLLAHYNYPSKLLAASLQNAEQVRECVEMGVHAVTVKPAVFNALIEDHPQTIKSIHRFNQDWEKAAKRKSLPL